MRGESFPLFLLYQEDLISKSICPRQVKNLDKDCVLILTRTSSFLDSNLKCGPKLPKRWLYRGELPKQCTGNLARLKWLVEQVLSPFLLVAPRSTLLLVILTADTPLLEDTYTLNLTLTFCPWVLQVQQWLPPQPQWHLRQDLHHDRCRFNNNNTTALPCLHLVL